MSPVRRTINYPTWRISFYSGILNLGVLVSPQSSVLEGKVGREICEIRQKEKMSRLPSVNLASMGSRKETQNMEQGKLRKNNSKDR